MEKKKNNNSNISKWVDFVVDNKKAIYGFVGGLLIGLLVMIITEDAEIAKLENGQEPVITFNESDVITADDLYGEMKDFFNVSVLLDLLDDRLLASKYPETDDVKNDINTEINSVKESYGDQFATLLQYNGLSSEQDFYDLLLLDYRRTSAVDDHIKASISDKEVEDYYNANVIGDINTKHILAKYTLTSTMTEEEKTAEKERALNLAKEIIDKLNSGKSFDEVKEEYKDSITYEELGYLSYDASIEKNYVNEMRALEKDKYSTTPIETSYGYHVIYKIDELEKPTLEDAKSKILDKLTAERKNNDQALTIKSLFEIRENAKLEFKDSVLGDKYDQYKKSQLDSIATAN